MQLVKVGSRIINLDMMRAIAKGSQRDYKSGGYTTGAWVEFVAEQFVEGNGLTSAIFVPDPDGTALMAWCEERASNVLADQECMNGESGEGR